jgi:hypothetical protein
MYRTCYRDCENRGRGIREGGGAVAISRRDGSARGRDDSLPSSRVRVLGLRPGGHWSPASVRAGGGGFEEAKTEDGAKAER